MSEVASLKLCKELYELSGWNDPDELVWRYGHNDELWHQDEQGTGFTCPAYDLGYLLRKLPRVIHGTHAIDLGAYPYEDGWFLCYERMSMIGGKDDEYLFQVDADTPEDALTKLAIELFKQGVLPLSELSKEREG